MERYTEGYFGLSCVKELGEGRRTGRKSQVKFKMYIHIHTYAKIMYYICIYAKLYIHAHIKHIKK